MPTRMATIKKKQRIPRCGEAMEKSEPLCLARGNGKWCSYVGVFWWFLKKLNIELSYDLTIPLLSIYPKKLKAET